MVIIQISKGLINHLISFNYYQSLNDFMVYFLRNFKYLLKY
jgi:hypothetical protein